MTTSHVAICFDFIRQPELFEVSNLFTVDLSLIHAPPSISPEHSESYTVMFQVSVEGILASLNSAHTHAYPASIEAVFPKVLALGK
jgi:hypothetical protein